MLTIATIQLTEDFGKLELTASVCAVRGVLTDITDDSVSWMIPGTVLAGAFIFASIRENFKEIIGCIRTITLLLVAAFAIALFA